VHERVAGRVDQALLVRKKDLECRCQVFWEDREQIQEEGCGIIG
jgi:hypothetical protein